jgi:2-oxoglutarate dehydrogenase E1 component
LDGGSEAKGTEMDIWREFAGPNLGYVLDLYDRYRADPASVPPDVRAFFEQNPPPQTAEGEPLPALAPAADPRVVVGAVNLAAAIREYGSDYEHARAAIRLPEARVWLRETAESRYRPALRPDRPGRLLRRLTEVEAFEQFLQKFYPGKTRFSIEGLDMLVPILDDMVGRLPRMACRPSSSAWRIAAGSTCWRTSLQKPYAQILAEFKDPLEGQDFYIRDDLGWTGDVKYHKGARRALTGGEVADLIVSMVPNPSHLEFVNPSSRAWPAPRSRRSTGRARPFRTSACLPILIHGDASFPGQGIVSETLNLQNVPGWRTGGTIHIIANNQVGFTAERRGVQHAVCQRPWRRAQDARHPRQRG